MNDDMLTPQSLFIEQPRRDRITAISSAVQRRSIVLVLGMHRSGTSLCSHLLSALGVDMADRIPGPGAMSPTPDNPRGHWERWEIVEFHDRILGLFNRDYFGCCHDFPLPVAWWADPRVAQIRREIVAFLDKRMDHGYFGFKDPRTVRLMPVWHQIFSELKLAPKLVLCLRNPAQVARSLKARDGLDSEIGEYRWLVHMIDFFRYTSNFDFCTVEYEEWFNNPAANIEKLQKFLDVSWQQSEADLGLVLSDIIDRGARHDDSDHRETRQPLVRTLYKLACRAGQDDGARDQIARIVSQFVSFQQLQKPFLQVFATLAEREMALADLSRRAHQLRAALQAELAIREAVLQSAEQEAQEQARSLTDGIGRLLHHLDGMLRPASTDKGNATAGRARVQRRTMDLRQWQAEMALESSAEVALDRPIGIFVHLFYEELADEIAGYLAKIDLPKKVYISTNSEDKRRSILRAFEQYGLGSILEIIIVPNYGMDVAPFLIEFIKNFADHDICLKIHGKRSCHNPFEFGESWRSYLYHELMGSGDRVRSIVQTMIVNSDLGILMPNHWDGVINYINIGTNYEQMQQILSKLGIDILPGQEVALYPSGSMFWFRSEALSGLAGLGFDWLDFGHAGEATDGMLEHGMERCFLFFCADAGKRWAFLPGF